MNLLARHSIGWFVVSTTLLLFACCCDTRASRAADAASLNAAVAAIRGDDMQQHVNLLASDTFEGREAGSRGGRAAGAFLTDQLRKLKVAPAGEDGSYEQIFNNGYRNILAVLPGSDPKLKVEYILVGAHYDHVGYGSSDNSLGPIGYIHNGADDNASGTAGLLALVKAFASLPKAPPRSILFAFWDGEEKGLLGSEHWVADPTVSISKIGFAFNMDMIGRLREQRVEVFGVRTAPGLRHLLAEQNQERALYFEFNWDNVRDSDHYPFYQRRIPYLMMFTRKHDDYHRPSDDVDKINHEGMEQIVRVLFRTIDATAERPQLPRFRDAATSESQYNQRQSSRPLPPETPRLGLTWEEGDAEKGIVRVKSVRAGSPADQAGLKPGDRIIRFGGYPVDGTHGMHAIVLAAESPAEVVVERPGTDAPLTLVAPLHGDARRIGMTWRTDPAEPDCVIITRIDDGSPAAVAGVQANDRVHSIAGEPLSSPRKFRERLLADAEIDLTIERRGQIRQVRIKPLPRLDDGPVAAPKPPVGVSGALPRTP